MKRRAVRKASSKTARSASPSRKPRPRVAIGPPRPQYLLNQENDRMMMIIAALVAEVSALRERLDSHEVLAERHRFASAAAVDGLRLSDSLQAGREQARQHLLARVFRVVVEELDSARLPERHAAGDQLAQEVAAS